MSDEQHSPEPWVLQPSWGSFPVLIEDANGVQIGSADCFPFSEADLRHIIACVNACEGFDPRRVRGILASVLAARKAEGIVLPPQSAYNPCSSEGED